MYLQFRRFVVFVALINLPASLVSVPNGEACHGRDSLTRVALDPSRIF